MTILEARKKAGLSRKSVTELIGIPSRTLEDWEAGKREPAPWAERLVINELIKLCVLKAGGSDADILIKADEIINRAKQ